LEGKVFVIKIYKERYFTQLPDQNHMNQAQRALNGQSKLWLKKLKTIKNYFKGA
jgi:hypothetical protein